MELIIETPRLRLAPFNAEHADGPYLAWMNDQEVTRFLEARFRSHTADDLRDYIAAANAAPNTFLFGIFVKNSNRHIGNVKIGPIDLPHRRGDIGLLIGDRDQRGKGYATEAIIGATRFAFERLDLHKVTAGCYANNKPAIAAFLKADFHHEGTRPGHYWCDGEWVGVWLFGKVRDDV